MVRFGWWNHESRIDVRNRFYISGFYPSPDGGCWVRSKGRVGFLSNDPLERISVNGSAESRCFDGADSKWVPGYALYVDGRRVGRMSLPDGGTFCHDHECGPLRADACAGNNCGAHVVEVRLTGVGWTNFLAMLGRKWERFALIPRRVRDWLQPFRRQERNRSLRLDEIRINGRSLVYLDGTQQRFDRDAVFSGSRMNVTVIGWFHGILGVGESARSCVRAARSVGLDVDAVNMSLKLNGATLPALWTDGLVEKGRGRVTIAHVDAPQSADLAKSHPVEMDRDRYRIGYWAWELPEFPDAWISYARQFDEVWCPSDFCREAMAAKLPVPVLTMPHAVEVPLPAESPQEIAERLGLPEEVYHFLFAFDFNSYSHRKNPEAVIQAYAQAFPSGDPLREKAGLVIKVHGKGYGESERHRLESLCAGLSNVRVVDATLTREEFTCLQWACDAFVSLHRSEGFGLAVAEMMALGKPVISTDWSATREFVNRENGYPVPVKLVELDRNVGPYSKGQIWAEPDVDVASGHMRLLVGDPESGRIMGSRAKKTIAERFSRVAVGKRYLNRMKSIALFAR